METLTTADRTHEFTVTQGAAGVLSTSGVWGLTTAGMAKLNLFFALAGTPTVFEPLGVTMDASRNTQGFNFFPGTKLKAELVGGDDDTEINLELTEAP